MSRDRNSSGIKIDPTLWMVTFADLLMLLLTFFVLLLSMSSMDIKTLKSMFSVFSGASGALELSPGRWTKATPELMGRVGGSTLGIDIKGLKIPRHKIDDIVIRKRKIKVTNSKTVEGLFALGIAKGGESDDDGLPEALESFMETSEDERGVIITFQQDILFGPGEAEIRPEMFPLAELVAEVLRTVSNEILIIGHSDKNPLRGGKYRSNWDLSLQRALSMLNYFVEKKGLSAETFRVGGWGDLMPRFPNDTKKGRDKNRRVEIIIRK